MGPMPEWIRPGGLVALLLAGLGAPDPAAAQTGDRWTGGAIAFVRLLEEQEYDSAAARVSDVIPAGALSADRLSAIWSQITGASGPLLELLPSTVSERDGQHIVDLEARFERQPLKIRVVLDDALDLTGLWFLPPEPPPYTAPPYIDESAFREVDVGVGEEPWLLPGTLSLPDSPGPQPVVVLVHGSGAHDRDETVGPNRPFRDIAGGLASRGIAVLRYEKRTRAHAGRIDAAGFTVEQEVIEDALAAIRTARNHASTDPDGVYLAGHSLGAMLAPAIARRDGRLAGIALLAAPARPLDAILRDQLEYIAALEHTDEATRASIRATLDTIAQLSARTLAPETTVMGAPASYYYDLAGYDPVETAVHLELPVLVVHGGRDYQVNERDLVIWRDRLSGTRAVIREFPSLNHLFIEGDERATPTEYFSSAGHVAVAVIEALATWIGASH
jgi:dienelactone hydrolase